MESIHQSNPEYLEECIMKGVLESQEYLVAIMNAFEPEYFNSPELQSVFEFSKTHFEQYKELPSRDIIINSLSPTERESVDTYIDHCYSTEFDIARNYDWLKDSSNEYLKEKSIKSAVRESIQLIERNGNINEIRGLVESALCKDMKVNLGLNYFDELGTRLHRMFTDDTQRMPTYFPAFDDIINGGFPPKTLSVFVAKIHGFKSNVMANMIARQVLAGHNVALASLEMSEDMFAQRFDGIYTQLDINRFYFNESLRRQLTTKLAAVKATPGRGNLFIKSFPTGKASVADFRSWVRELGLRGVKLDCFFFDYLNLMRSELVGPEAGMYGEVKNIAEETRAMAFEFDIPMISVSQLNRTGTFMSFSEVDFNSIAESMGVPATADFMMIMGANQEEAIYQNEVHYKIVKNRLGGRVGTMDKFFYDARSMKMYCSTEQNIWMSDVASSEDDRELVNQAERENF